MTGQKCELGLIGLGTMGQNLLMNMADSNYAVAGYDKNPEQVDKLKEATKKYDIFGAYGLKSFITVLKKPRIIVLLVPAGKIVDYVIADLIPQLENGDIIIDGGNSYFVDTDRRIEELKDTGIHFVGMGISGGAKGARKGPSMMPGGHPDTWNRVKNIFEATAAKANGEPCVAHMGNGSAGHYVKMVHNGIEYGLMELLAEAYDFMKNILGLDNDTISQTFKKWDSGRLQSFLVEITGKIFTQMDTESDQYLIDVIRDESKSKGTGKWTSQDAMDIGATVPVIDVAVVMRYLSALKPERGKASSIYNNEVQLAAKDQVSTLLDQLESALYFSFAVTYAQGMAQLKTASSEYKFNLNMESIAAIWRAGCIIRADFLEDIRKAYQENNDLENLLLDGSISNILKSEEGNMRKIVSTAITAGLPFMAFANAITYFDGYRSKRLPANLIQAQRDYFGSHTYERMDKEGKFHTEWNN
ncbi:NADP-dependent phosphogluconate dehydrogenase [Membranihabitans maritimus]|uniref:NADP-dependent phosphogluconate dehydrogenase n=1 Tax=Membranihabitans maritimus TaxID=2904244 RepID=UPI001F02CCB7|nr:NADP-dependent phosphogluconate dehydrogenase [Membranihabitans maritimus]